ncbi:unnamed protein product [Leptosia nina]|uniref:Uncharacterized protein n=1 Tax=Leptosia nina TaxID=320188 RepID=A0AAV1K2T7_9NEOP
MLNLSPSSYRNVEVDRNGNVIKVYASRPWWDIYDPNVGKERKDDPDNFGFEAYNSEVGNDYFGNLEEDPVTALQGPDLEPALEPSANPRYEQAPTSPGTLANVVNLREAVLVALGGASAAVVLLLVMAGVFCARRRKNSPSPVPSPPILVYPPHDITTPCYL